MEMVMFQVACMLFDNSFGFGEQFCTHSNICPAQDMQDWATLVADLIWTSLFFPFYKYFVSK